MAWQTVEATKSTGRPMVTIRSKRIAFNKLFREKYKRDGADYGNLVEVLIDPDLPDRLGFVFHRRDDVQQPENMFVLQNDQPGLMFSPQSLFQRAPLSIYSASFPIKLFPMEDRAGDRKVIFVQFDPVFDNKVSRSTPPSSKCYGVYRYVNDQGNIVYIGRGWVSKRLQEVCRKDWDFDVVEWFETDTIKAAMRHEKTHLELYEKDNGVLPKYNKIHGFDANVDDGSEIPVAV